MRHLYVIVLSILLSIQTAYGCSCAPLTEEELFNGARAVYLAEVTDTKLIKESDDDTSWEIIEANFTILEKFKGPEEPITKVHDLSFGFGNCSIGLMSGMEFVFFISESRNGRNYVGMCGGSKSINLGYKDIETVLNKLRSYPK